MSAQEGELNLSDEIDEVTNCLNTLKTTSKAKPPSLIVNLVHDVRLKLDNVINNYQNFTEMYRKFAVEKSPGMKPVRKMVLFNINGFNNDGHIKALQYLLSTEQFEVVFLVETRMNKADYKEMQSKNSLRFSQIDERYEAFIADCQTEGRKKGGLMILVKKALVEALTKGGHRLKLRIGANSGKSQKNKTHYHEACSIDLFGIRFVLVYRNNQAASGKLLIDDVLELLGQNKNTAFKYPTKTDEQCDPEPEDNDDKETDVSFQEEEQTSEQDTINTSEQKFVILGDFNTSNIKWLEFCDFNTRDSRASANMITALKEETKCNRQWVRAPTSGKSMRPIDLIFAKRDQSTVKCCFVAPFLDRQKTRDHVPVYFLVNQYSTLEEPATESTRKEVKSLRLRSNPSKGRGRGKN